MVHLTMSSDHLKTGPKKYLKSQIFGFQVFGIQIVTVLISIFYEGTVLASFLKPVKTDCSLRTTSRQKSFFGRFFIRDLILVFIVTNVFYRK